MNCPNARYTIAVSIVGTLILVALSGCGENVPQRQAREKLEQRIKTIENELDRPRSN